MRTLAIIALVLAAACKKAPEAPESHAAVATKKVARSDVAPPPKSEETYTYSSIGKRDPFRSYLDVLKQKGAAPETGRRKEETEKYELDQYKLTGLITGSSQPQALVEDPQGRGHVLRIGARLGKNGGRLTRIISTEITVVEEYRDPKGKLVRVPITIKLPKAEIESGDAQLEPAH